MTTGAPHRGFRMRVELGRSVSEGPRWPGGVRVRSFTLADAERVHSLLEDGYRNGGGSVADLETWRAQGTEDEEYDPSLWILAESDGALVGAILCWTSGFVKDLVVTESWRGRGLGEALMRYALRIFAAHGIVTVDLKVHADNASAIRLYERIGMRVVEHLQA